MVIDVHTISNLKFFFSTVEIEFIYFFSNTNLNRLWRNTKIFKFFKINLGE